MTTQELLQTGSRQMILSTQADQPGCWGEKKGRVCLGVDFLTLGYTGLGFQATKRADLWSDT